MPGGFILTKERRFSLYDRRDLLLKNPVRNKDWSTLPGSDRVLVIGYRNTRVCCLPFFVLSHTQNTDTGISLIAQESA
jgi:hypothetical protein